MSRPKRRLLCIATYGGYVVATPMAMSGYPLLELGAVMILAGSLWAAFRPLFIFSRGMDYRRMPDRDYREKDWWLPGKKDEKKRRLDEVDDSLARRTDFLNRWILGAAIVLGPAYGASATSLGFWLPTSVEDWSWITMGAILIAATVPTTAHAWINKEAPEYHSSEDC